MATIVFVFPLNKSKGWQLFPVNFGSFAVRSKTEIFPMFGFSPKKYLLVMTLNVNWVQKFPHALALQHPLLICCPGVSTAPLRCSDGVGRTGAHGTRRPSHGRRLRGRRKSSTGARPRAVPWEHSPEES